MYKGLLIDLGNTIIYNQDFDFIKGIKCVYQHAIKPNVSLEQFLSFTKQFTKSTYDNREQFEINFKNVLNYLQLYFDFNFDISLDELEVEVVKKVEKVSLVPGIVEVLELFYQHNCRIVVLSNSTFSSSALTEQIKDLNIKHYFTKLLSSSDNIYRKPDKYFFELGVSCLGYPKEEILYIGNDYYFDIIGESNAEIPCCWYNEQGFTNDRKINCLEVKSYFELLHHLQKLQGVKK